MAIPTYDRFIEPLLRLLASCPDGLPAREAHAVLADRFELSDADRQELLPSGAQAIYKNRIGWAHDRLKRAGFSVSPKRGLWQITPQGQAFVETHPEPFEDAMTAQLAMGYLGVRLRPSAADGASQEAASAPAADPQAIVASPEDRLGQALAELRQAAESELLEFISRVSPAFFETIVLDLLHRMGYGASRADLQRVGGAGDGGIDGVISLDRLGLEKVYVQAKRWHGNVGRPELQAFYGALAGQKARKGIFITSSAFTPQAVEFARSVEGMVLIDGSRLASLMIDHDVGVTARSVRIPKIDSDYFDEEGV
ncbi:MAG TPA: restriction endonuclease [Rubrivivax sp.]|nr:restriction endonuclease [Rubrivivax sp.]